MSEFMFVPTILFLTVVAPIWLVLHYRSLKSSSRGLNENDREEVESMLATVDKLIDRIEVLESIIEPEQRGRPAASARRQEDKRDD
ncbi:MAG: phage shock protein B [Halieaceae bacterium]|jgi:phage shock protein B